MTHHSGDMLQLLKISNYLPKLKTLYKSKSHLLGTCHFLSELVILKGIYNARINYFIHLKYMRHSAAHFKNFCLSRRAEDKALN